MPEIDPAGELASRDIVARAIYSRVRAGQRVFLDLRPALEKEGLQSFPSAVAAVAQAGLDALAEPVPVVPAAHYHMGGIQVDARGRSSLNGLWACGEVAAAGIHGANRLASNSLLEAVVCARRVADDILQLDEPAPVIYTHVREGVQPQFDISDEQIETVLTRIRTLMSNRVGIQRNDDDLRFACHALKNLAQEYSMLRGQTATFEKADLVRSCGEVRNLLIIARLIALAALRRTESRGAHFRRDFPQPSPFWQYSQLLTADSLVDAQQHA